MDNIKTHNIDGNRLIEDLENNKYWIIFKNYLGEEITSEIPKDIFDAYIESKSAYKKNKNEEGIKHQAIHIGLDRSRKKLKIILKKFEN